MRRIVRLAGGVLLGPWVLVWACIGAAAAAWAEGPASAWPAARYNPQPLAGDIILPLPCGGAMAFRWVATPLPEDAYPVAGPFAGGDGQPSLLVGKYELTRLQAQALRAWAEGQACPKPDARSDLPHPLNWSEAIALSHQYSLWLRAERIPDCVQSASPCLPRVDDVPAFVRLPLETEWEYAARGGLAVDSADFSAPRYPMAEGIDAHAWHRGNAEAEIQAIGARAANPLGLHDLYGNVAELMLEPYRPGGPGDPAEAVVVRGGSIATPADALAAGYREQVSPVALEAPRYTGTRLVAAVPVYTSQAKLREAERRGLSREVKPGEVPPPPEPVQFVGHLRVRVNVPAEVSLDGKSIGRATPDEPLEIEGVEIGEHRIEVVASKDNAVTQTYRIDTNRWTDAVIELEPVGHLRVRVNVPTEVSLDGRPVGRATPDEPLEIEGIAIGEHRIEVVADTFQPVTRTQRVVTNRWVDASIELKPVLDIEPEMVSIEGGCFEMGSPSSEPERDNDERQHRGCVDAFEIGKYAVTFDEYDRFARETGRDLPEDAGWGRGKRPVINVNWEDAVAYAAWLSEQTGKGYRLPTEAEWEYAARAGTTTPFWTGRCIHTDQANYDGKYDYNGCGAKTGIYREKTVEVGSLPANPWGLHEVHGNVWEWTCSAYEINYDGSESRCVGAGERSGRVVRGGSWSVEPGVVRSALRSRFHPVFRFIGLGFRLARTLSP